MAKMESIIRSEIVRLARMELRKVSVPLRRDVWRLKSLVSQIKKSVLLLERFAAHQQKELGKRKIVLEASPEEVKLSRFSPRLLRSLRKTLDISQGELAILAGVTVGAVQKWEAGRFRPKDEKRRVLVALRKVRRRDVRKLLEERGTG
jgi:DNA-binding transcriptional regulator YiaG